MVGRVLDCTVKCAQFMVMSVRGGLAHLPIEHNIIALSHMRVMETRGLVPKVKVSRTWSWISNNRTSVCGCDMPWLHKRPLGICGAVGQQSVPRNKMLEYPYNSFPGRGNVIILNCLPVLKGLTCPVTSQVVICLNIDDIGIESTMHLNSHQITSLFGSQPIQTYLSILVERYMVACPLLMIPSLCLQLMWHAVWTVPSK